ncbi:uncharacterized protein LOC142349140 [Convolutriloba macropyga]|uniref:uncharacterized protein LOC142349140 n=1 Tax=Convolutriloba macropyga TaxID=536237 RepID=UPI003F524B26
MKHLEEFSPEEVQRPESESYYILHHVRKEDSVRTKLRVVFNASAKTTSGLSLNDCLMVGTTVQPDLFSHVIRLRFHQILLAADMLKFIVNLHLTNMTKTSTEFFGETPQEPIKHRRMTRVTYGIASSAFQSTRCLQEIGTMTAEEDQKQTIQNDFYVEDYLRGAASINEAYMKPDNNHGWRCSSSPYRCKNEGHTSQNTKSTPS